MCIEHAVPQKQSFAFIASPMHDRFDLPFAKASVLCPLSCKQATERHVMHVGSLDSVDQPWLPGRAGPREADPKYAWYKTFQCLLLVSFMHFGEQRAISLLAILKP